MPDLHHICVLGPPRSGTNFLCNLLADNLNKIRFLGEVLANRFERKLDPKTFNKLLKKKRKQLNLHNYLQLVSKIALQKKIRILLYKILYYQTNSQQLENLFKNQKQSTTFLLIKRNPLDSFISDIKANKNKQWKYLDTTNQKIGFHENDFQKHYQQIQNYENLIRNLSKKYGCSLIELQYEDLHQFNTNEEKMAYLINLFGIHHCPILKSSFNKQDRSTKYQDKVKNYDGMISSLKKFNLLHLVQQKSTKQQKQ